MLDLTVRFKNVIKSFHISLYEQEGDMNEVFESTETSVGDVLSSISERLENKPEGPPASPENDLGLIG